MTYILDSAATRVSFSVKHLMISTARGTFSRVTGAATPSDSPSGEWSFEGEVDVLSVSTGDKDRDSYLRTNEFLDPSRHPTIVARSTRVVRSRGSSGTVHVDLTVRGVTRNVVLEAEFYPPSAEDPKGKRRLRVVAKGALSRKDFGLSFGAVLDAGGAAVGDKVSLEVDAQFLEE